MKRWKNDTKIFDYVADREFCVTDCIVFFRHRFNLSDVRIK